MRRLELHEDAFLLLSVLSVPSVCLCLLWPWDFRGPWYSEAYASTPSRGPGHARLYLDAGIRTEDRRPVHVEGRRPGRIVGVSARILARADGGFLSAQRDDQQGVCR